MNKNHSVNIRELVVDCYNKSVMSLKEISETFKVSIRSIFRWALLFKETGSVEKRKRNDFDRNKIQDLKAFKEFIDENNDKSNKELAKLWSEKTKINVSASTIQRNLNKINYTFKKKQKSIKSRMKSSVIILSKK